MCVLKCTRVCVGHESRKKVNNRRKGYNGGKQKMIECMWHEDKGRGSFVGNKGTTKGNGGEHNIELWKVAMNKV